MTEQGTPPAPESFLANQGDPVLTKRRNAFLEEVVLLLGFTPENSKGIVEIRTGILSYVLPDGPIIKSEDKVAILNVRGEPSAIVVETVNEQGLVRFNATFLTKESILGLEYMPGKEK